MAGQKLTPKQEAFCLAYLETGNASEAYRRSYNAAKMASKTITEKASLLLSQDNVRARVDGLKAEVSQKVVWEKADSLNVLAGIAKSKEEPSTSRIAAVKELNAMHGYNAPSQHQHQFVTENGEPITGISITVRAVSPGEREFKS